MIKQLIDKTKDYYNRLKEAHVEIKSLAFVKLVILISFLPIGIYLSVWTYTVYALHVGINVTFLISLLSELRQFVSVIFSTQTVTGILAYGVALIDKNHDGESDELIMKTEKQGSSQMMNTDNFR